MNWPWDYRHVGSFPYGDEYAYATGMPLLDDCETVEDWGCGTAWAKRYRTGAYVGIDMAPKFADIVVNLSDYTSDVDGIFMRSVLEHNLEWEPILRNAVASFRKRLVLILFTPMQDETRVLNETYNGIPNIGFAPGDIEAHFGDRPFRFEDWLTDTQFGVERMYVVDHA
jgi:hypothetical protein